MRGDTKDWSLPVIIALSDPAIREEEAIRGDYIAAGNQRLSGPANIVSYKRRCRRPRNIEAL